MVTPPATAKPEFFSFIHKIFVLRYTILVAVCATFSLFGLGDLT